MSGTMSVEEKLDLLLELFSELNSNLLEIGENQAEILEKVNNLGTPGSDFSEFN